MPIFIFKNNKVVKKEKNLYPMNPPEDEENILEPLIPQRHTIGFLHHSHRGERGNSIVEESKRELGIEFDDLKLGKSQTHNVEGIRKHQATGRSFLGSRQLMATTALLRSETNRELLVSVDPTDPLPIRTSESIRIKSIAAQLLEMGFPERNVLGVLEILKVEDLNTAIEFLIKGDQGWEHAFTPLPGNSNALCAICYEDYDQHMESMVEGEAPGGQYNIYGMAQRLTQERLQRMRTDSYESFESSILEEDKEQLEMMNLLMKVDVPPFEQALQQRHASHEGRRSIAIMSSPIPPFRPRVYSLGARRSLQMQRALGEDDLAGNFPNASSGVFSDLLEDDKQDDGELEYPETCAVCYEDIVLKKELFSLKCEHKFCISCVKDYLEIKIKEGEVLRLFCPQSGCEQRFALQQIEQLMDKEQVGKYLKFRENIIVNKDKNLRWCPIADCGQFVRKQGRSNRVGCECGFAICFKCGNQWHGGHCADQIDRQYKAWAKEQNVQRCPKCSIPIQKDEGCNHMTCRMCYYQWCWVCGMKYSYSHYDSSFFGCPGLQFISNSNWGYGKICLILLMYVLLWPFFMFYFSAGFAFDQWSDVREWLECACCVDNCLCGCLNGITVFFMLLIYMFLAYPIMLLPAWGFQIYKFFFLFIRMCKKR